MKVVLDSFLREINEKTTENDQYPVLTSSKAGIFLQSAYNKQVASRDNTGYKVIRRGQFTYRAMSDTGEFFPNMLECTDIGIVSPAYPVFEISKPDVIMPEFLKYYFKSDVFQHSIASFAQGSTRTSIKFGKLKTVSINLPSVEQQIRIIRVLDKTNKLIKNRTLEMQKLDELIKARFVELFGQGNHEIVKASEVCDFITKGTTPPTGDITEEYSEGMIPFLKVYNLSFTGEMLFDDNSQYIPSETHNGKLARSKVYPNDVLMNIVGPPLGKFTLVTDEFEEWNINQAIAIFRAKERILPRFLLHALKQPAVLEPFIGQAVGIRQQNLSLEQCRNLQFPLPSMEEQKAFVDFAEQLDKSKVAGAKRKID